MKTFLSGSLPTKNTHNGSTAEIKPIDTTAKYELTYEKNSEENIETNYFKTEDGAN